MNTIKDNTKNTGEFQNTQNSSETIYVENTFATLSRDRKFSPNTHTYVM